MTEAPFPGPFRLDAGRRAGLTPGKLRGSSFQRLSHGVYAAADAEPNLLQRVGAALLIMPRDAIVTGVTALHLHGVEVGDPLPIRAVTATGSHSKRAGVYLIRATVLPPSRLRIATPVASWLTACTQLNLLDAVIAADWLVRLRRVDLPTLIRAAQESTSRGCRLARRAASLARARVDSPQETRLRLALVLAGLPTPRCNINLGVQDFAVGWVDLMYEEFKVILEYDGDYHRLDREQWNLDLDRNDAFADGGYLTMRVTAARMRRPRNVVRRVYAKLVERGYSGPPPVFGPEWCKLFEGRRH